MKRKMRALIICLVVFVCMVGCGNNKVLEAPTKEVINNWDFQELVGDNGDLYSDKNSKSWTYHNEYGLFTYIEYVNDEEAHADAIDGYETLKKEKGFAGSINDKGVVYEVQNRDVGCLKLYQYGNIAIEFFNASADTIDDGVEEIFKNALVD